MNFFENNYLRLFSVKYYKSFIPILFTFPFFILRIILQKEHIRNNDFINHIYDRNSNNIYQIFEFTIISLQHHFFSGLSHNIIKLKQEPYKNIFTKIFTMKKIFKIKIKINRYFD